MTTMQIATATATVEPVSPVHGPLHAAYLAAKAEAERLAARCDSDDATDADSDASIAADEARDAALAAYLDSDEDKEWVLGEDGSWYDTVIASSIDEALDEARSNVDRDNYDVDDGTLYIDVRVRALLDHDREAGDTVVLSPEEPDCTDHSEGHDWQSPYEVLGGLRENPGVWGHGGGVICKEVCSYCGRYRVTDTWAQRRDTGEQGLTEVSYKDADESSRAWLDGLHVDGERDDIVRACRIVDIRHDDWPTILSRSADELTRSGREWTITRIDDSSDDEGAVDPETIAEAVREQLGKGWEVGWERDDEAEEITLTITRDR